MEERTFDSSEVKYPISENASIMEARSSVGRMTSSLDASKDGSYRPALAFSRNVLASSAPSFALASCSLRVRSMHPASVAVEKRTSTSPLPRAHSSIEAVFWTVSDPVLTEAVGIPS